MAKRPNLTDIENVLTSATTHNANNDEIETAFDNTLSRDGSTPNQMEADIDMNSNDLLNVKDLSVSGTITLDGLPISVTPNPPSASYETRSNFVSAVSNGLSLPDGSIVSADGLFYEASSGATALGDLLGWLPFGDATPNHFGDNLTPGTTDMRPVFQSAFDAGYSLVCLAEEYYLSDEIVISKNGTTLKGAATFGGALPRGTQLTLNPSSTGNAISVTPTDPDSSTVNNVGISDLHITGGSKHQ